MEAMMVGTESNVRDTLREFIITNFLFGDTEQSFTDDDSFIKKGIMDSTGILELIEFLEQSFGVSVGEEETVPQNLDCVSNVIRFVERKRKVGA